MKKLLYTHLHACFRSFVLLLAGCISWALPAHSQTSTAVLYRTQDDQMNGTLFPHGQDQYSVLRNEGSWSGPGVVIISELAANGTTGSHQRLAITGSTAFLNAADGLYDPTDDSRLIVGTGQNDNDFGLNGSGFVLKLDNTGALKYAIRLKGSAGTGYLRLSRIKECTPTSYMVVGGYDEYNGSGQMENLFLAKIRRSDGALLAWISLGSSSMETGQQLLRIPDQNLVMAFSNTQGFDVNQDGLYVVGLDTSLNRLWSRRIDGPGFQYVFDAYYDGTDVFACGTSQSQQNGTGAMLLRLSTSGTLLDARQYSLPSGHAYLYSLRPMPGGGWIFAGSSTPDSCLLLAVDAALNPLWATHLPDYGASWAAPNANGTRLHAFNTKSYLNKPSGCFWVMDLQGQFGTGACNSTSATFSNNALALTDSILSGDQATFNCISAPFTPTVQTAVVNVLGACPQGVGVAEPSTVSVGVYPQPATDQVRIRPVEVPRSGTWHLCDAAGRCLVSGAWPQGNAELTLDLAALSVGIYCFRLRSETGSVATKIVKVD